MSIRTKTLLVIITGAILGILISIPFTYQQTETIVDTDASLIAPVIGIVVDQNHTVITVEQGSAAERVGVKVGDIVEGIDNMSISTNRQGTHAAIAKKVGQALALEVIRDGKRVSLTLTPATLRSRAGQPTPTPVPAGFDYF